MEPVYVTGHRNPDTDSVVAALSYTALRHALGDREYRAVCLDPVSDETWRVLTKFGFLPPERIDDVYNRVRDLDFDRPPVLGAAVTVARAWTVLQEKQDSYALPVANDDGTLYGMLSRDDVARFHMELVHSGTLRPVPVRNLLSVLEGRTGNEAAELTDTVGGEVVIAVSQSREELLFTHRDSVVICGDSPELLRRALELEVKCLVICQTQVPQWVRHFESSTVVLSTPYDAYRAARLIFQATPVGELCQTRELMPVRLNHRVNEVREKVLRNKAHCYPVLDEGGRVAGVLTRQHLLRPRRKRVVLVDHNEASQSVAGLAEAQILEIIDHHRLADIQTSNPIYVRNEPVGSTNTIIAGMFQEWGVLPSPAMAGLMAAAIVSDTVMFKSPTCTQRDRDTARRLARMADISLEELGREIFSANLDGKSEAELLTADYKEFQIALYRLAVAQITCVDSAAMLGRKAAFLEQMGRLAEQKEFSMVLLMVTDVLREGTWLLYVGGEDAIRQAFRVEPEDNAVFLPGVMSRKKQIIPSLADLWA